MGSISKPCMWNTKHNSKSPYCGTHPPVPVISPYPPPAQATGDPGPVLQPVNTVPSREIPRHCSCFVCWNPLLLPSTCKAPIQSSAPTQMFPFHRVLSKSPSHDPQLCTPTSHLPFSPRKPDPAQPCVVICHFTSPCLSFSMTSSRTSTYFLPVFVVVVVVVVCTLSDLQQVPHQWVSEHRHLLKRCEQAANPQRRDLKTHNHSNEKMTEMKAVSRWASFGSFALLMCMSFDFWLLHVEQFSNYF